MTIIVKGFTIVLLFDRVIIYKILKSPFLLTNNMDFFSLLYLIKCMVSPFILLVLIIAPSHKCHSAFLKLQIKIKTIFENGMCGFSWLLLRCTIFSFVFPLNGQFNTIVGTWLQDMTGRFRD